MESTTSNTRYAVGDGDGGQGGAIIESTTCNLFDTIRNSICALKRSRQISKTMCIVDRRGEGGASTESRLSNTRYAVGDSDGSQFRATRERLLSNTRYAVRDSNRSQTIAIIESIISNSRNAVGDNGRFAASNKGIGSSFDDGIAILAAIVSDITFFN